MSTNFWVEKAFLLLGMLLSAKGLWEYLKAYINRGKEKAQAERIITETYQILLTDVKRELSDLRNENTKLDKQIAELRLSHEKEMSDLKLSHANEIKDERERYMKQSLIQNDKIVLLEKKVIELTMGQQNQQQK